MCPICHQHGETVEHALLACSWIRPVWFGLQLQIVPSLDHITTFGDWFNEIILSVQRHPDYKEFALSSIGFALWTIWKMRNVVLFEGEDPNPMATLTQASVLLTEFTNFIHREDSIINNAEAPTQYSTFWRRPRSGCLKINSDAAFDKQTKISCSGIAIRDDLGNLLTGSFRKHAASTCLSAEALALRDAVILAKNLNLDRVIFESDCMDLVKMCRGEIIKGEIVTVVGDIQMLKQGFSLCGFSWCSKKRK